MREPAAIAIAAPIAIAIITVDVCIGCVVFGCGVLLSGCGVGVVFGICDGFGVG
jgi:hypothetical protein